MVGRIILGLSLSGLLLSAGASPSAAQEPKDQAPKREADAPDQPQPQPQPDADQAPKGNRIAPPGEEFPQPFVPRTPRTAEDRKRLDTLLDFATARAHESRRDWRGAIALYEAALNRNPDSVAIQRRLARLSFMLGRGPEAVKYAEQVLEQDPGDMVMLTLVLESHLRKNDLNGAEAMLRKAAENPKLSKRSAGYLLIERNLGDLYASRLRQLDKAAEAYEQVVSGLDDKEARALTPTDVRRILGDDEAAAYTRFGAVFFDVKRYELAIQAFRHAQAYGPGAGQEDLPRFLALALLRSGKPEEALRELEPYLKRQPDGREPYELLVEVLKALQKTSEILPRLEAAARNAPKNKPLQYLLADQYRAAGQRIKADAILREILASQPDPQGFAATAATLLKDKKFAELLKLLGEAAAKPDTFEVIKPQIELIANDAEAADGLFEAGLKAQQAEPPALSATERMVLAAIANESKRLDKFIPIQRLALKNDPNPDAYREFWLILYRNGKYEEAAGILDDMLNRFPNERTPQILIALAQSRALAGQFEPALTAAEDALKLNPNDQDTLRDGLRLKGFVLGRLGKNDEAIAHYQAMIEKYPNNQDIIKLARSGLSIIYVNQEKFDKGEHELELLLEMDPDDPGVNNDLGYLYADRGKNLEKAESMIRKAVASDPDNAAYLDSLGWILFRRGKLEEAVEPLEKASQDDTADTTIHDHLGDVYFKLKRLDKARDQWRKAAQMAESAHPPDKKLAEIRKKLESLEKLDRSLSEPPDSRPKP